MSTSRPAGPGRLRRVTPKPPFEAVVAEHGATVLRVCRAVLGPADADDAWSETFLAALRAYPRLPGDANVEAWLVTIAHRKAIDVTRAAARHTRSTVAPCSVTTTSNGGLNVTSGRRTRPAEREVLIHSSLADSAGARCPGRSADRRQPWRPGGRAPRRCSGHPWRADRACGVPGTCVVGADADRPGDQRGRLARPRV